MPVEVVANGDRLPDRGGDRRLLHRLRRPTNAVKHARATKVMLRAVHEGSRLVVAMVDDGRTVSQNARRDGRASGSPYRRIGVAVPIGSSVLMPGAPSKPAPARPLLRSQVQCGADWDRDGCAGNTWVCQPELAPACSFDLAPPVTG